MRLQLGLAVPTIDEPSAYVEGDASSGSYFLAGAAITGGTITGTIRWYNVDENDEGGGVGCGVPSPLVRWCSVVVGSRRGRFVVEDDDGADGVVRCGEWWVELEVAGDRRKLAGIWPDMGRRRRKFNGEGRVFMVAFRVNQVKPSTSASGSQPSGNTKKDRIQRPSSSTKKNKVEAHHRTVKSSLKNKNCVLEPKGTTNVQHSKLNANFELICVKCNACMLSGNHELCAPNVIINVNARPKSKSVKKKSKRKVWKPTGKVIEQTMARSDTDLKRAKLLASASIFQKWGCYRYTWRPTDQTVTIVGNECPLTRIITTAEVSLRKPIALESDSPKPEVSLVYSRKPRNNKTTDPVSKWPGRMAIRCEVGVGFRFVGGMGFGGSGWNHLRIEFGFGIGCGVGAGFKEYYNLKGLLRGRTWTQLILCWAICDSNLKVAFHQHTCFIRNIKGVDLLTGSRGNNLYTLSLRDMMASSPICLLSKASKTKSWLWNRRLSHLNFGAINHLARHGLVRGLLKLKFEKDHLCSACAMGERKKKPHKPKSEETNQEKLYLLHMDLCGPMRIASVNGKKYILFIVDDYSQFTWVKCLRLKDEVLDFIIKFLKMIQHVGISHETSVARSLQQNGLIERHNRTLIKAARTMLIYAKALLFLWAEAVATACYTQNCSMIRLRHGKTPYELLHNKTPDLSFLHVFGALCFPINDSENLGKLQPKADIGIFIGYAPTKKAFRIYNRRTRRIIETIHVDFDELTSMASEHSSSGLVLHEMTPATISLGLVPNPPPSTPYVPPLRSHCDILFQLLFDELLTPSPSIDLPAPEVIALIAEVVAPDPAE
ncbi:retrovirus-related pol polyprotein from transposon TNT 1-94 [Tanacetum coccineum]